MADCTECGAELVLPESLEAGEIVDCTTCGAELEVLDATEPTLDTAPDLAQDWGE